MRFVKHPFLIAGAIVIALLIAAEWALGQSTGYSVTVTWDANTEPDIAGYRLSWSTNGSSGFTRDCRLATTQTVSLPSRGPWTFRVSAYNAQGIESLPSAPLSVAFPATPAAPRIVAGIVTVTTNWIVVP